jgi:hypothetical protein
MKKTVLIGLIFTLVVLCPSTALGETWTTKAHMPTGRGFLSTAVVNGKIYAIGGVTGSGVNPALRTAEEYDPATDTWSKKANMPTARCGLSTSVIGGRIYAIGGATSPYGAVLSSVEVYDPATDTWVGKADMPTARAYLSASSLNGKIYAIGGASSLNGPGLSVVEVYDPATDTWTKKADMPTARLTLSTSVADVKIYAIGGTVSSGSLTGFSTVEEYDSTSDTWTKKADMPTARWALSTSAVAGKIYAIGGHSGSGGWDVHSTVELYNPATDTWTTKTPMPTARRAFSTSVVGGKIYAIGGVVGRPGRTIPPVEEYDTGLSINPPLPDDNIGPVADAGFPRYAALDPVVLDGTGSYGPDNSGDLSYAWRQMSAPSVTIIDPDTATPTIGGSTISTTRVGVPVLGDFIQTDEIQECVFELTVSDGQTTSLPDTVKVFIVPDSGANEFLLRSDSFDPNRPTFIYCGGGDCIQGGRIVWKYKLDRKSKCNKCSTL